MTGSFDPTATMIIARALGAAAQEMGINLIRSAFSTVVREARDCSAALLDAEGNVVAQGEMIPMQTAALSFSFKGAKAAIDLSAVRPGTAILMNDPYSGGQHLHDLILFQPIFVGDDLVGYAGSTAHHLDIGGGAPGVNTGATDLIQEGLVIPPLLFEVERDWHGGNLERLILANIRTREIGLGDLNAQFAANHVGIRRVREIAAKWGVPHLRHAMAEALDYSERRMRREIARIPDGSYEGSARVDRDIFDDTPIAVHARVTVRGEDIEIDFAGTDAQVRGMLNCPLASAHAAALSAVRTVIADKDIPPNDGCNRPLTLHFPHGSVLNPRPGAPVRARMSVAYRALDAVHQALAQAMPQRVPAQGFNTTTGFYITQLRPDGSYRVYADVLGGGYGASRGLDGADALDSILSNCRNTPIEAIEQEHDHLLMRRYGLVADSGGAGQWRGGLGFIREVEVREPGVRVSLYSDHFRHPPQGLAGGQPGGCGSLRVFREGETIELDSTSSLDLRPGDRVELQVGGGGGWGDPTDRDPGAVARDLRDGRITPDYAARWHGPDRKLAHG